MDVDKFSKKKENNNHPTAYMMVAIKSSKLQVNLHNEKMKGNEMTANYL